MTTKLITRPRLVSFLMSHGIQPKPAPNPWRPDLKAWTVELTPETETLIAAFFAQLREGGRYE